MKVRINMKRLSLNGLAVLLVLSMLAFAACGNNAGDTGDAAAGTPVNEQPATEQADNNDADGYSWKPAKAITIVVPTAAGDYYDTQARVIGAYIEKELGQPVTYEYMPGAGQAIAAKYVYTSEPDGYTIGYASSLPLVVNQLCYDGEWDYTKLNYFATCMNQINDPAYLELPVAASDAKFNSWDDILNATEPVRWASVGEGSAMHVVGVILAAKYGFPITHLLGYDGGNAVAAAIARNEADTGALPWSVLSGMVADNDVKGIFNIGSGVSENFPDAPSLGADYPELAEVLATRHLLYGPPEMDKDIADTLAKVIYDATNTAEMEKVHVDGISGGMHYVTDDGVGTKEFMLKLGEQFQPLVPDFKR